MAWRDVGRLPCSIARTLSVVGDRWTVLILREAFTGTDRFDDFQRRLGIARNVLASRLDRLLEHGVLERRPYQTQPVRQTYELTKKGTELYPILLAMLRWGDQWMDEGYGPPIRLIHERCGNPTRAALTCEDCGEPLAPSEVRALAGPGLMRR